MYTRTGNIDIDDAVLVRKCQEGDPAAMERLIIKYQGRIYNTILKMCGNPDDAAELAQEAFVKVLEGINDFEGRSGFYTWLFRIAVNLTLNFCKRRIRPVFESLDAQLGNRYLQGRSQLRLFLADESSADPVELAEIKEMCEIVTGALMKLDEPQRAVVVLRDIEGMNYAQIAQTLDIELGTVKSRLSRARDNLRKIVEAVL